MCLSIHPFLLFTFLSFQSSASFYYTPALEKAYKDILELKIEPAKQLISIEQIKDPSNGIAVYLQSLAETSELFLSEDIPKYQIAKSSEAAYLKAIGNNDQKTSPYYKFCLAEIKLQWAFAKMKFGDEVGAVLECKQSLSLLNENLQRYPTFVPTKKSLGLLNIVLGSIPSSYSWLASTLGFSGNVDTGMNMLEEVAGSKTIFYQEALMMKILAEQYILNKDEKMIGIKQLHDQHPSNLLYTYLYAAILSKHSQSETALLIIRHVPSGEDYLKFPFIDYLHGDLLLQNGNYVASRIYFNKFLLNFKGKNLLKDTYYKLFLSYWLNNEDAAAMTYWRLIPTLGQTVYESDKYANKIALSNELPDKKLAMIRLFTDGGLYTKALAILNETNISDFYLKKDKIEYYYRAARLYHKSGRIHEGIEYYKKVISVSNGTNYYFAPNSALQLGYIYQQLANKELAVYYFNMAISYKNHEYENSIEQKAKAGLNQLK